MKRYKISKENLNEFLGFLVKKKTPAEIQNLIDNDPILQKLQKDAREINDKTKDYFDKLKTRNPELYNWVKKTGMINPKD